MTAADVPNIPGPYLLILAVVGAVAFLGLAREVALRQHRPPEPRQVSGAGYSSQLVAELERVVLDSPIDWGGDNITVTLLTDSDGNEISRTLWSDDSKSYPVVVEYARGAQAEPRPFPGFTMAGEPLPVGFDTPVADILDTDLGGHRW